MLTGFEALGAASAVLQVISFATDITVACKKAYDGATTSEDDLHRHAKQMVEAVDRVKSRCGQMTNTNASFSSPELKTISQDCIDAAKELEAQASYVTSLKAKGDIGKAFRKAFKTFRRKKKLEDLEKSLLSSRSEAIRIKQESAFQKLDADVQSLVNQLARGVTDVQNLVKHEHTTTRSAITQETTRAEVAINSHTDSQVLELRTTAETSRKCEVFLQSLKAPRMNQRYNDVMDSRDASFKQVFATYEEMIDMYHGPSEESDSSTDGDNSENTDDSEDHEDPRDDQNQEDDANTSDDSHNSTDVDSDGYESSEAGNYFGDLSDRDDIFLSWDSLNKWLRSNDKFFYIQGKPGSGKSTLVKFILNQDQTKDLIQTWSPDAIIISYFLWKIGAEEQNSIKGLWCSLLYKRLQDQQPLISRILQHFSHFSSHSEYHDWSVKDLQDVWNYVSKIDTRHICIFIDGLDEVRNEDGFSKLAQSIQLISQLPRTKLCVSARPEAQIVRWLRTTNAAGILLEDLTRSDMCHFVRDRFCQLLPNSQVSLEKSQELCRQLVSKAQGVFLWLHLATRSIIEGIENSDSEKMLFARLNSLPGDLQNLYIDLWQRMNTKSPVYVDIARRYLRYVLQGSDHESILIRADEDWIKPQPLVMQIACAENFEIQEKLLKGRDTVKLAEILRKCQETKASIQSRCAGLLEVRPKNVYSHHLERLGDNSNAFGEVAFIHRTAHDFLVDTEAGQGILGCGPLPDYSTDTQLLNGLICTTIVLTSEWPPSSTGCGVIDDIAQFANRWGSKSLSLAKEMLDIVRPLYDRKLIRVRDNPWEPSDPFLSQLARYDLSDEFVISLLETENSPVLATNVLRKGWAPGTFWDMGLGSGLSWRLSKRLSSALMELGAIPHEYGIFYFPSLEPFAVKETAFTNFLIAVFIVTNNGNWHRKDEDDELHRKKSLETLEIAIHMATTCQNLDKVVPLFAFIVRPSPILAFPVDQAVNFLKAAHSSVVGVVFEVTIQFLLLYIMSKIGGDLADSVLESPHAQHLLSRINSPVVKIRYLHPLDAKNDSLEQEFPPQGTFQRILQPTPLLRGDIELLFDVCFKTSTQELCVPLFESEGRRELDIIRKYVKDKETKEVDMEDMMTSLAAENLGICTYEEADIIPSYEYLRRTREARKAQWRLFPSAMGRLEAAAAIKEGIEGHE